MHAQLIISDDDITYAEQILLRTGNIFDEERRSFIRNLDTIDLQAVPGSGKTTALLAKLLILEKYLPFPGGAGILVISHTNAAIDEIKEKISYHCPKLFSPPNFIGTIQSFVDQFLAVPYYSNLLGHRPSKIDSEFYDEKILNYNLPYRASAWVKRKARWEYFLQNIRFDEEFNLIPEFGKTAKDFELTDQSTPTYKALFEMKMNLFEWGILHYNDAYLLAKLYLKEMPKIREILQKRFRFVFVDEMQDMAAHQYELLETIFFCPDSQTTSYQRLGDKNQAIYNATSWHEVQWQDRSVTLELKGSHRLTEKIANVVTPFALRPIVIHGRNGQRTEDALNPHVFVFDDKSIGKVIPAFIHQIERLSTEGKLPEKTEAIYKAIAWRKETSDRGKLCVLDYWPRFSTTAHTSKEDHSTLEGYLFHVNLERRTLESARKSILNALLRVLRLENIHYQNNRPYTKKYLLEYLKHNYLQDYEALKLHIYNWSMLLVSEKTEEACAALRSYCDKFLQMFNKTIRNSKLFIESRTAKSIQEAVMESSNRIEQNGIEVEVTTIHGVKGQTLTGVLYLESFYQRKYEIERLAAQFLGQEFNGAAVYDKQATKMVYVGFSRPTHLLSIAIHKDRFDLKIFEDKWQIIKVHE